MVLSGKNPCELSTPSHHCHPGSNTLGGLGGGGGGGGAVSLQTDRQYHEANFIALST